MLQFHPLWAVHGEGHIGEPGRSRSHQPAGRSKKGYEAIRPANIKSIQGTLKIATHPVQTHCVKDPEGNKCLS